MRYDAFLAPQALAKTSGADGLSAMVQDFAQVQQQLADRQAQLEAVCRGRAAFLCDIEVLRLALEDTKLAHGRELDALRAGVDAARASILKHVTWAP